MGRGVVDVKDAASDAQDFFELAELGWNHGITPHIVLSPYIHALIRANDALCWHFLKEVPEDHDRAADYFRRLYGEGYIDEMYGQYASNLRDTIQWKNDVEYQSKNISRRELERYRKQVKRFIKKAMQPILKEEGILDTEE